MFSKRWRKKPGKGELEVVPCYYRDTPLDAALRRTRLGAAKSIIRQTSSRPIAETVTQRFR